MASLEEIKQKIEEALPGARAEVLDPRKDGVHLKAIVTFAGFAGKSLVDQHRMVMNIFKDDMQKDYLHALSLETKVE